MTQTSRSTGLRPREFEITMKVEITAAADLTDPFVRVAIFRALTTNLAAEPLNLDTMFGPATATIGLVTGSS